MKLNIKYPSKKKFAILPTPIITVNKFIKNKNGYNLWIKRDDLSGLELSGNKVRKLEYIFAEAEKNRSNHIITCGGVQSNHCRATAFIARKSSLNCTLFLKGDIPSEKTGNYLLNSVLNTNIMNVTNEEYQNIDTKMDNYAEKLSENAYVIPEGGSNEIGVWGYIECYFEILEQIKELNISLDTIVVPTGSGGTHAGLLLGKILSNSHINVVSINVCDSSEFFKNKINNIITKFLDKNNYSININNDQIEIFDGFVGEGYGLVTGKEIDVIKKFAQDEGIIVDPVYTAKAIIGLENLINSNSMPGKNILFIHTGGIYGLFSIAHKF